MKRQAAFVLGLVMAAWAQGGILEDINARGEVRMGVRADAEPLSYIPPNTTTAQGFAVELCLNVLRKLEEQGLIAPRTPVRHVPLTNANRFQAMLDGRVDMECADTTNNRERREQIGVAFSIPHYYAGIRMLVASKSGIKSPSDLRSKTVLVTQGTTTDKVFADLNNKLQLKASVRECAEPTACFADLSSGKSDAYLMDDIQLFRLRANASDPQEWEVVGRLLSIEPLAIMLPKNDPVWKGHFDRVIREMMLDRSFHAAYAKWFESPIPPSQINYKLPMSYLLRDSLKFPSDQVGD